MITTQYSIRLDLKDNTTYAKAEELLDKCHTALFAEKTISVESMDGNGVCAPYIEVVTEDLAQAQRIERICKEILGRWLVRETKKGGDKPTCNQT